MSFDIFFQPCRYPGRLVAKTNPFTRATETVRVSDPLTPSEVKAVQTVLKQAKARGPDEHGCYVAEFPDGGGAEVYGDKLDESCMVAVRGITPKVLQFLFDILNAGNWVMLPAMEDTIAITCSPNVVKNPPKDFPKVILVNAVDNLGVLLSKGFRRGSSTGIRSSVKASNAKTGNVQPLVLLGDLHMNVPTPCLFVVFFKRPEPFNPPNFPRQHIVEFIRQGNFVRKEPKYEPPGMSPKMAEPQWFSLDVRLAPGQSNIHARWSDWNHVPPHFIDPWKHMAQGLLVDAQLGVVQQIVDATDCIGVHVDCNALTDEARQMLDGLKGYLAKTLGGVIFVPGEGVYDQDTRLLVPLRDPRLKSSMHCQIFGNPRTHFHGLTIAPNGKVIGTVGDPGNKATVWDAATGEAKHALVGHKRATRAIAFSPADTLLATGSEDKTVILWDSTTGKPSKTLVGHGGIVGALAFSPDGSILASGGYDGRTLLWNMPPGERRSTLHAHGPAVAGLVDGKKWHSDESRPASICSLAFSPDGKLLASGGTDGTVRLCDVNSGTLVRTLEGYPESAWPVTFSPNGKLLAAGSYDRTVRIWNPATGVLEGVIAGHAHYVFALAFSPDGKWLATGSTDTLVRIWDVEKRVRLRTLCGHAGAVNSVAFFPEGRKLASASQDGTVRLWNLE